MKKYTIILILILSVTFSFAQTERDLIQYTTMELNNVAYQSYTNLSYMKPVNGVTTIKTSTVIQKDIDVLKTIRPKNAGIFKKGDLIVTFETLDKTLINTFNSSCYFRVDSISSDSVILRCFHGEFGKVDIVINNDRNQALMKFSYLPKYKLFQHIIAFLMKPKN